MLADLSLLELIPALRPDWRSPRHLADWCSCIERSLLGHTRAMCSVPFQHYKSTTTLVGVVWLLLRNPKLRIILLTHSHEKAQAMGKELRALWKAAGGATRKGFDTIDDWQTDQGGGCVVMSAAQSKLGYPCDLLLVDDPLDETEYMLTDVRKRADDTIALYTARAASHLDSVLIVASRWHPDDPIGRRLSRHAVSWVTFFHPGILDLGTKQERAFAPDVLSLEQHRQMRREWAEVDPSERTWWAQVQNQPMPDALGFFVGEREFVGEISPLAPIIYGVDAAFTSGKKSDFFASVGTALLGDSLCVFDVRRHQRGLTAAMQTLSELALLSPLARFVSYVSGPEKGIYNSLFESAGIVVEQMPARWNKAVRAQKSAKTWQDGKILTRFGRPWTGPFLAEMHAFDGREDGVDDQADALVAAHDAQMLGRPAEGFESTFAFGRPCM
jgi:hypothetical protein